MSSTNFLDGRISREAMEDQYIQDWRRQFSHRLRVGRRIQRLIWKKMDHECFCRHCKIFALPGQFTDPANAWQTILANNLIRGNEWPVPESWNEKPFFV